MQCYKINNVGSIVPVIKMLEEYEEHIFELYNDTVCTYLMVKKYVNPYGKPNFADYCIGILK